AVRCLLVLLLVLAMASVTSWAEGVWHWMNPEGGKGVVSGGQRTHKIIVVDGSFSMGVRAGDTSCFEKARALAGQIVSDGAGGNGFSVVLMAAPPRRIVPEPSEDTRKVANEIGALRLTHGNADLAATLSTVESLLQASPGKFPDKEVYFLTDLQQSTWIARQPGALSATLQKIQAKARTVFVDVGQDGVSNLAVTGLALGDPLATTARETPIVATLNNYGDTRENLRVRLSVGRARALTADKPYTLREVSEVLVPRAERGQQTPVTFAYKFPAPGDYVVRVAIEHDGLELDDERWAVVTVKNTVPVMLVNGKPAVEAYDRATEWLRNALNPFDDGPVPATITARPKVLSTSQFADEGLGDLTPFDCVFLCDVPRLSPAEVRRLERHVRRGGSVVFCLGDQVEVGSYNDGLFRDGAGLLPARLLGKQRATPGYSYQFVMAPGADREDPLKPFRDPAARERLLAPRFRQFLQCEPARRAGPRKVLTFAPVALPGKENVANKSAPPPGGPAILEWNPPAGKEPGAGRLRGRVVLITTTVNSDWNNWPASPAFPPLMQEVLNFAAAARLREQAVPVGDPIELFLPNTGASFDAVVTTPDGRKETVRTQGQDEASLLRWTDTDVSGVYRAAVGQHPREYLFAVNAPAVSDGQQLSESNLARTNREELQKTYPEWETQVVTDLGQVEHTPLATASTETVVNPQGPAIAHALLLGLLVLLLAEVVLAWQFGHYSSTGSQGPQGAVLRQVQSRWRTAGRVSLLMLPWLLFAFLGGVCFVLVHNAWTGDFLGFLGEAPRQSFERLLDIPQPAAGEGRLWRLEFLPAFTAGPADAWLSALVVVAATALIFLIYRREGHAVSRAGRALFVGLRVGLLLLVVAVFLRQPKLWFERQGWPDVAILIDDSYSMSSVDKYRDPQVKAAADRLAELGQFSEPERLRLAQALLTRSQPDLLTTLLTQRKVRLHVYHCAGRAHRVSDVTTPEDVEGARKAINEMQADPQNDSSQLGTAVRQVLNDFRGSSLAAVVMLTDGVTTEGEDLPKVSKYAAQMGVPLYFVGVGDAHEVRDVYLHDLTAADSVFVNDHLIFNVQLTAQGYDNLSVPVRLYEKGKDRELDRKTVQISPDHKTVKVTLKHQPTEPGEKIYVIKTPVQADEVEKDNNQLEKPVFVHEAKQIKVLYVEGYRRYEYHFIKTLLERESARVKGNKSIDLKVLLLDADPEFAEQDRSAISEFPTREELKSYDVVILGDVDPKPRDDNKMTEHLKDLADFVREKGGGLLMIAGERFAPETYKDSPLKDVLPIDVTGERPDAQNENAIVEGYKPELTPVGRTHPIFRFSENERESDEIWGRLREMYWYAEGYQPKRAAEVLAVHPKLRRAGKPVPGADDRESGLDRHPLVVQQFSGAGRCLFFGFNESWRWGFREDLQHFNRFWLETVRYLARSSLGRIDLRLDRQTPYRRGEPIKLTVRFPDDAPPPPADTEVKVVVERRARGKGGDTEVRTVQLAKVDGSRATYEALLTQTPEGDYKFWLSQPTAPSPKPRAECRVLAPPGEMELLRMNQPELERAAEESHGKFYTLADVGRLADELPAGNRVTVNASAPPRPLWNLPVLFLAALLLLTTEWLLRKQKNLL
ncbi:MAG TPA: VWA domain-containing protein, partial [Gemmataceae bacterium]|nr:VWA domain-containing protein [Gemmataceae bacterium]